jgi:general stress protein 26
LYVSITISDSRQYIADFLSEHHTAVLATVDQAGQPHAATIYVTCDRDLTLYFVTKRETQKSRNLQKNVKAAIALHDAATLTTLQAEGTVSEVLDPQQQEWVFNDIWRIAFRAGQNGPPPSQILAGGYVVYRFVTPTLRLARFNTNNPDSAGESVFEVTHTQPTP